MLHPSLQSAFREIPNLDRYSDLDFIKKSIHQKCPNNTHEESAFEIFIDISANALARFLHETAQLLAIIRTTVLEFKRVAVSIKQHKYNLIKSTKVNSTVYPESSKRLVGSYTKHSDPLIQRSFVRKPTIAFRLLKSTDNVDSNEED